MEFSIVHHGHVLKKSDHIYLATDLDREGEAIAWHLREVIGGDDKRFSRVVFNEITKKAIEKGLMGASIRLQTVPI